MTEPECDHDSDYFYQRIRESTGRQMQEDHIIWGKVITADLGFKTSVTFSEMKSNEYHVRSREENERRSKRVNDLLPRARAGIEPEVWKMVLEMGLGKVQAQDITFDKIGDKIQDKQHVAVRKPSPNLNALQMWLRHHSQMYRSIESGGLGDGEDSDIPTDVNHGTDIGK